MKKQKFLTTFLFLAVIIFTFASSAFGTTLWGNTPSGTVGKYYSASFSAYSSYGISFWSSSGYVPGLSFSGSGSSGRLSGYPTTPGSYSITITVYDQNFGSASQ